MSFQKAVNSFKKYLIVERGFSSLTVKEYNNDLQQLYKYLVHKKDFPEKFSIEKIERFHLSEFLSDMVLKKNNAPVTRNRKLYSIRSFFKYLKKYNLIEKDPSQTIEASKTKSKREPIYLKQKNAARLLAAIKKHNGLNIKRDQAIVKLFLYSGLRLSELIGLNVDDINFEDFSIKFFGKGNKERFVPLHQDVILAIKEYFPERNKITPVNEEAEKALFLSRRGKRISPRSVQVLVKKYAKKAGLKNASQITPHKLRHTFASMLYRETKDLRILQELLGHESISTTQIYTHTDTEERKNAIQEIPKY